MVRRYMPTYRNSKKLGTRKLSDKPLVTSGGERSGDRIPTSQWKEENSSRCQRLEVTLEYKTNIFLSSSSASLARTVSERLRSESVWLMKEVS